jgi:hypothetical protein
MPNQDGTGPQGQGPKTGRGFGLCQGAARIAGWGNGFCRRFFSATRSTTDLDREEQWLGQRLAVIREEKQKKDR